MNIYVGTYAKYNNGSIYGEWVDITKYNTIESFYEKCENIHKDELDPEYMFQDYEYIPKNLVSESWISKAVFQIIKLVKDKDERIAFLEYIDNKGYNYESDDIDEAYNNFKESFVGKYSNMQDYFDEELDERLDNELEDNDLRYYINYKQYYENNKQDYFYTSNGYLFYNI